MTRGHRETKTARVLVNAAGPWIGGVADIVLRQPLPAPVRLIKGSHIVVRRRFEHDGGYLLQAPTGAWCLPCRLPNAFTLIGTTDENFLGDVNALSPDAREIVYLCNTVNDYFREKVVLDDLIWSYSGVRSLYDDGANRPEDVTRDYMLTFDEKFREAPLLTIYGGKITTYRRLAEAVMARIASYFTPRAPWTANSQLPGGEFPVGEFDALVQEMIGRWPFLTEPHARRLARAYGRRAERILKDAQSLDDLGPRLTGDLTGAEVRYLVAQEWAQTAEDVLWRRSKLGLTATAEEGAALVEFIKTLRE